MERKICYIFFKQDQTGHTSMLDPPLKLDCPFIMEHPVCGTSCNVTYLPDKRTCLNFAPSPFLVLTHNSILAVVQCVVIVNAQVKNR